MQEMWELGMRKAGKKHRKMAGKRSNPKSKKACEDANMKFVKAHKSKSAKGKSVKVKGFCRKSHNKK